MKNKHSRARAVIIFALMILAVGIILDKKHLLDSPKSFIYSWITPIQGITYGFTSNISNATHNVLSFGNLRKENTELKSLNEKLISENTRLLEIDVENKFLRKQLGVSQADNYDIILASVVGTGTDNNYQKISIDKGLKNNVKRGDAVVTAGNILIGKIEKTYDTRSEVILLNNPETKIPALLQNTRSQGIIRGEHGTGIILDFIPVENELKPEEKIVTLGIDNIPAGLAIGEVETVNNQPGDLFKKATVKAYSSMKNTEKVFVMTSAQN